MTSLDSGGQRIATPGPDGSGELSPKEQALWLFQQFAPEAGVLNVPLAMRLGGRLRWWPLHTAVSQLIRRHPALRTVFPAVDGMPVRIVLDPEDDRAAVQVETTATSDDSLERDLRGFAASPIDLTAGPAIRVGHFTGCQDGDVICVVVQHIVFDASSATVLVRELVELYRELCDTGRVPERLAGVVEPFVEPPPSEESLRYWREHLAGAEDLSGELDLGRNGHRHGFAGGYLHRELAPEGLVALRTLTAELRVTQNIVLLAVYYVLLSRHGAGADVVVGLPVDARDQSAHGAIGYHVNIVGMRVRLDDRISFRDFVRHCRDMFLRTLTHSRASIDEVFPGAYESGAGWRRPLFRYLFNHLPPTAATAWTVAEPVPVDTGYTRLDLSLVAVPHPEGLTMQLFHRVDAFGVDEVSALLERFETLLGDCARRPDAPLGGLSITSVRDKALIRAARETATDARLPVVLDSAGRELPPGLPGELCYADPGGGTPRHTGTRASWMFDGTLRRLTDPAPPAGPAAPPAPTSPAATGTDDETLRALLALWRELLDEPDLDPSANFFSNGGSSVLAGRLVARIKALVGVRLSLRQVFSAPTPAALAQIIRDADNSTRMAG